MRVLARGARASPAAFLSWRRSAWTGLRRTPRRAPRCWAASSTGARLPDHNERTGSTAPALVIGHPRDPVHPFSDAGMLASELPHGRLINAHSVLELRVRPDRLTAKIAAFVRECWDGASVSAADAAVA